MGKLLHSSISSESASCDVRAGRSAGFSRHPALLLACSMLVGIACANEPAFLITAGTTAQHSLDHHAYIIWEGTSDTVTAGKSFAVYAKTGQPSDPGLYSREGVITPVVRAEVFAPLLERSTVLGENLPVLDQMLDHLVEHIDAVLEKIPNGQRPSIPHNTPIAKKLERVLVKASQHPSMLESIGSLKARHPAMALCLGQGWTGRMTSQVMTYEVREFNPATSQDIAVVGRLTLDWTLFPNLVAPGKPFWVQNQNAEGNLNIRLRWVVPDALRRLGIQVQGYNIYRCAWQHAQTNGWDTTAPSLNDLKNDGSVVLASKELFDLGNTAPNTKLVPGLPVIPQVPQVMAVHAPVFPSKLYSEFDVTSLYDDTFFFADDNRRYDEVQPGAPFVDQAQYAYFVVARDLLGREGAPSLAGLGIACATLPPSVPDKVKAVARFNFSNASGGQVIRISWKPNTDDTQFYEIYRTTNVQDFAHPFFGGKPNPAMLIGTVNHAAGDELEYIDTETEIRNAGFAEGNTFAYAVRAARDPAGPCGPFYSAPSPPVFASLRDYKGPNAPAGDALIHCSAPYVHGEGLAPDDTTTSGDGKYHFQIKVSRADEQIAAVTLYVYSASGALQPSLSMVKTAFAAHENSITWSFASVGNALKVQAVPFGADGAIGWPDEVDLQPTITAPNKTGHANYIAATVDPCSKFNGTAPVRFAAENSHGLAFNAGAATRQTNGMGDTIVHLTPGTGPAFPVTQSMDIGVFINVDGGSPIYLSTVSGMSSSLISFVDADAASLTNAQLVKRYRLSVLVPAGALLEDLDPPVVYPNGWRRMAIGGLAVVPGTQVCVGLRSGGVIGPGTVDAQGHVLVKHEAVRGQPASLYKVWFLRAPAVPGSCTHVPATDAGLGLVTVPVTLTVSFAPESVEYRIYRRIDDGPMTLIAQDNTEITNDQVEDIVVQDGSMPQINATIRYFAQAFDKNGNPSPLTLIKEVRVGAGKSTPLPTPTIMPPTLTVDGNGDPTLHVKWFSPVDGVDRFHIILAAKNPLNTTPPPNGVVVNQTEQLFDPQQGKKVSFFVHEVIVTGRPGVAPMTSGPNFAWDIAVTPGIEYFVAVRALAADKVDQEGFTHQVSGEPSMAVTVAVPPKPVALPPSTTVPWPARPLPAVESGGGVQAAWIGALPGAVNVLPGPALSAGVKIAEVFNESSELSTAFTFLGSPNAHLLGYAAKNGQSAIKTLPAVLYRQEVLYSSPGVEVPAADRGPVVQCSTLIPGIVYSVYPNGSGQNTGRSVINDPTVQQVAFNTQPDVYRLDYYLMDKLPQRRGATYRYWLVHFGSKNEPDRVIYAGTVTIPTPP